MKLRSIESLELKNKRVILRVGFDVPLMDGKVSDDTRLKESLPTIKFLLAQGCGLTILSHLGRPNGRVDMKYSQAPVADKLQELLPDVPVRFIRDSVLQTGLADGLPQPKFGEIVMLENIRFCAGEETNDLEFAKSLAKLGEIYVDDAFSNAHRDHASVSAITNFLPSYAGLLMAKEIESLSEVLDNPPRPFVAIIGGAKISTKINLITSLLKKVDFLLLGGALANTILKAQGIQVGKSLIEEKMVSVASSFTLTDNRLKIPVDVLAAKEVSEQAVIYKRAVGNLLADEIILDIGADTVQLYKMIIEKAGTVVWNGPMGYIEIEKFAGGTYEVAKIIAAQKGIKSVLGGGETVDAINHLGIKDKFSFVSTGGGAMLEFLEGKVLPAIKPLIIK